MKTLTVGGLGIKDLKQITLETRDRIAESDLVVYLGTRPDLHVNEIKRLGAKNVQSIFELYVDSDLDETNYQRLYNALVEAADHFDRTVLLVPGHPRIGVTLVQWLEKNRATQNFNLNILPGISSFDTLLNDLNRDPLEKGSLMVDANRILLFQTTWDPSLDCYLYHVCSVGTRNVHLHDAKKDNAWHLLKEHLLRIYPANAQIELVSSSTIDGHEGSRLPATLAELESLLEHVHFGTTLFIRGQKPTRVNREFHSILMKGTRKDATLSEPA